MTQLTTVKKHDAAKARYDLAPPEALAALADVLTYGATKYSPRGWEEGIAYGRLHAALMRHLWAWWGGEDRDPESGMPHLWHVLTNAAFLVTLEARRRTDLDDRPKATAQANASGENHGNQERQERRQRRRQALLKQAPAAAGV